MIVAVLSNPDKSVLFTEGERVKLITHEFSSFGDRVMVKSFAGLLVDFARSEGAGVIIRGLRAVSDYDYEMQMALMNKNLCDDIETLFLMAREKNSYVSSSLVKQIASFGGDVSALVPASIEKALKEKLRGTKK